MPLDCRSPGSDHRDRASAFLWGAAMLFFVVGDLATTTIGLSTDLATEAGPIVAFVVDRYGLTAMIPLKAAAVAICVVLWKVTPDRYARGVPLGMAAIGLLVTAWNASILIVAL